MEWDVEGEEQTPEQKKIGQYLKECADVLEAEFSKLPAGESLRAYRLSSPRLAELGTTQKKTAHDRYGSQVLPSAF
jgi:hypothetical protein